MKDVSLISITEPSSEYELIDSGEEEKLERFGSIVLARPDPQAMWKKTLSEKVWKDAHARFVQEGKTAKWVKHPKGSIPEEWAMTCGGFTFLLGLSSFKHTGIFPEHVENWQWIADAVRTAQSLRAGQGGKVQVLNLFGYTGGATLAALSAGAEVCHVDASKVSIARAKENLKLSRMEDKPVRFILDDALAFVKREARRGNVYDGIIMDPPAFGRGPKNELWKIETHLPELVEACAQILSANPAFVLMNGYAAGYSPIAYRNNVAALVGKRADAGTLECGELTIRESHGGRLLPAGIFARWRIA